MYKKLIMIIVIFTLISLINISSNEKIVRPIYSQNNISSDAGLKMDIVSFSLPLGKNITKQVIDKNTSGPQTPGSGEDVLFGFVFAAFILGIVSFITGIPLLAVGIYNFTSLRNAAYQPMFISGAVCMGMGALFCLPFILAVIVVRSIFHW